MLGHFSEVWLASTPQHSKVYDYLLSPFATGNISAVMLFFVLSGFVLSLPAVEGKPQGYFTFLIRRIFRIYVPYICAILLALPGALWLRDFPSWTDALHLGWSQLITWQLVWQHVLFIGIYDNGQIDMPIWSLIYEMRISILFPLICAFSLRLRSRWLWVSAALLTCISILLAHTVPRLTDLTDTFHYVSLFLIGIYLARDREVLGAWLNRQGRFPRFAIAMLSLLAYGVAEPEIRNLSIKHGSFDYLAGWVTAIAAGGLMLFSMNSANWKSVLGWPPIRWLGRVSYSVYLLHYVAMLYLLHLISTRMPLTTILALSFVLTIALSAAFYHAVEVPAINKGRKLSRISWLSQPASLAKREATK
jgi:peptidoglycan/LPS O-acetylase OafA/YrhL